MFHRLPKTSPPVIVTFVENKPLKLKATFAQMTKGQRAAANENVA